MLGIIRGHRGALKIDSQPGGATTFTVLSPAVPTHTTPHGITHDRAHKWRGNGTVLVVDDEAVRAAAAAMTETCDMTVATAADGQATLDIERERRDEIVAVLIDMTMPLIDGEETFRESARHQPRCQGTGLAGFLQKAGKSTRRLLFVESAREDHPKLRDVAEAP